MLQKRIIRATVTAGKPVITATQMLDSMERNPRPTRAEVSDVANAIFDGSSALMLSGETAVGRYPVESVETMSSLALVAEENLREYGELQKIASLPADKHAEAVAQAAISMSEHLSAAAIICLTESGRTARRISKYRPESAILAVAMDERVVRRLAMNWGVVPLFYQGEALDVRTGRVRDRARQEGRHPAPRRRRGRHRQLEARGCFHRPDPRRDRGVKPTCAPLATPEAAGSASR